jgi:DNA-directed RNA polymerase subunit M/transcription elongation factor TFIIS
MGQKQLTTEDFVARSVQVHGNKYDYSETHYTKSDGRVKIICPKHGPFFQSASSHINGKRGCPRCGKESTAERNTLSTDDFIKACTKIHNGKYDYSLVEYTGKANKVLIVCPVHGSFYQAACDHKSGKGCRKCGYKKAAVKIANSPSGWSLTNWINSSKTSRGFTGYKLYFILVWDSGQKSHFIKIGRTFRSISKRMDNIPFKYKVESVVNGDAGMIYNSESMLKRILKNYKFKPSLKFDGWHECFSMESYPIIANELNKINHD